MFYANNFVFATTGSVTISAFVPEKTATTTLSFSSGGDFTFTAVDNTQVNFTLPANFYSENLELKIFQYDQATFESQKPPPSGKSFVGKPYDFIFFTTTGGSVSTLSSAPTIVMHYLDSEVSGLNESTIKPYRMGASDSSWSLISGSTVDTTANTITFATSTFSSFGILGAPACSDGVDNDGDGKTDYSADPGCSSTSDNDEADPAPTPTPTPSSSGGGGGGGGGGGYSAPQTAVSFSGRAYPKSSVTILKDAQIAATTIANANANFSTTISGLSGGNYIFAIYSEDSKGIRSSLLTFPVSVTSGATTNIGGVFIAPTIAVDKSEVKRGDNIAIFGQSAPSGEITISVSSDEEFFNKINADANGAYLYNFDTTQLDMGQHFTKSKAARDGAISSFSKAISFSVGTKNIAAELPKAAAKGDMNSDKRVNLVDFSIAAYWYKRPSPPANIDLNGDGKINLVDFSIMAFYWTG
ncbi:MAG: dockerin type I repeat-containing protein [bacterium]|nr:dockerin type I repeat-containing protein [bacterium]